MKDGLGRNKAQVDLVLSLKFDCLKSIAKGQSEVCKVPSCVNGI